MKTLRFHTGRGGRFNNQGHVTFVGFETIQDSSAWDPYFLGEDGTWKNEMGDELDCQINEDGTGYIDDDGEYDSDNWVLKDSLNDNQVAAIIDKYDDYFASQYPNSDESEIGRILQEYYLPMAQDAGLFNNN
jgi:hypothetical protein